MVRIAPFLTETLWRKKKKERKKKTNWCKQQRLTAELIQQSLSYLNPLKERELDLRGEFFATEKNRVLHFEGRAPLISIFFSNLELQDIRFPPLKIWVLPRHAQIISSHPIPPS